MHPAAAATSPKNPIKISSSHDLTSHNKKSFNPTKSIACACGILFFCLTTAIASPAQKIVDFFNFNTTNGQ